MQYRNIIAILLLLLVLTVAPVSATMATATGSGVSRGDYNKLAILEAKDMFKKSEGGLYVTPWVSIAPGSDMACGATKSLHYRYRLLAPDGTNHDQVLYQNSYDAGDGLLLSANGHFFTSNNAVKWFKVSDLINDANRKGFVWEGPWTMEFYFGDFDCTKNENTNYVLVGSKTFTLVDDSVAVPAATTSPTTTATPRPTTQASVNVPSVISYGVSANGMGTTRTTWGPGDAGQNIVAWIKITPGSDQTNGRERYTVQYRLIKPDGSVYYDNLNQGNAMSFNRDGSADMIQYPVAELLPWPGNWQVEYYIRDADSGTTTLINTQRFTIQSGTATAAATTRVTPAQTRETPTPTVVVPQIQRQFAICSGSSPWVYIEDRTMANGRTVTVPVMMCNARDVANMDLTITYNKNVLSFTGATRGSLNSNALFESNEPSQGTLKISFASSNGFSGSGSIAILSFNVVGSTVGTSPLKATITTASTSSGTTLSIPVTSGTFTVGAPVVGDYDGDNQLTARDALAALQISVGKRSMDATLDVTGDGSVNSADAREILKKVVGKA